MYTESLYPWISHDEWHFVMNSLFHEDPNVVQKALDIVAAWKARCPDLHSELILITTLISVKHSVPDANASIEAKETFSEKCALALIRFVNLVTEPFLKNSKSLTFTASKQLNIPQWIIEIRHNATHRKLPGYEILLGGLVVAIEWLKHNYLDKISADFALCNLEESRKALEQLLLDYIIRRVAYIKAKKDKRKMLVAECSKCIDKLSGFLNDNTQSSKLLFDLLLTENYLIPTLKQMSVLGYLNEDICEWFKDELPPKICILWQPIFNMLKEIGQLSHFVDTLLGTLTMNDTLQQMVIVCWLKWLCNHYGCDSVYASSINVNRVLVKASRYPTPCIVKLIDGLFDLIPEFKEDTSLRQWLHSFNNTNESTADAAVAESNSSFSTKNDLDTLLSYNILTLSSLKRNSECNKYGIWSLCSNEEDIMNCAIGLLPGQDPSTVFKLSNVQSCTEIVDNLEDAEFQQKHFNNVLEFDYTLFDPKIKEELKTSVRIL